MEPIPEDTPSLAPVFRPATTYVGELHKDADQSSVPLPAVKTNGGQSESNARSKGPDELAVDAGDPTHGAEHSPEQKQREWMGDGTNQLGEVSAETSPRASTISQNVLALKDFDFTQDSCIIQIKQGTDIEVTNHLGNGWYQAKIGGIRCEIPLPSAEICNMNVKAQPAASRLPPPPGPISYYKSSAGAAANSRQDFQVLPPLEKQNKGYTLNMAAMHDDDSDPLGLSFLRNKRYAVYDGDYEEARSLDERIDLPKETQPRPSQPRFPQVPFSVPPCQDLENRKPTPRVAPTSHSLEGSIWSSPPQPPCNDRSKLNESIFDTGEAVRNLDFMAQCASRGYDEDPFLMKSSRAFERQTMETAGLVPDHVLPSGPLLLPLDHKCPQLRQMGRNQAIKAAAEKQRLLRFSMAALGGLLLVVPVVIMSTVPGLISSLVTTCISTLIFAFLVAWRTELGRHEVLATTAAYAAVLVVFVGTSLSRRAPARES